MVSGVPAQERWRLGWPVPALTDLVLGTGEVPEGWAGADCLGLVPFQPYRIWEQRNEGTG